MEFPNDALRTCNSFREALAFKTAAIRHGISVAITVASLQNEKHLNVFCGKSYEDSKLKNLDDEEFFQQCAQYRLSIDPILRGNPYEVKLHSNETRRRELLPFFFDQGLLTLFLEQPETPSIRRELLSLLSGKKAFDRHPSTSISTLLFLHRGKIHRQKRLIQGQNWPQLKVYADAALLASGTSAPDEMKKLLDELRPKLVLLDISGYFTAPEENALMAAMDVCLENGVAVGIFCEDGNTPTAWRAMSDRELIIGNVNESTFIVKEKTASPPAIRRFDFSENTIIVTDATEEDLAETMRYQEEMITE
ncbi:hypothetical protein SDC9_130737 [bioreactor metagenome]|uniref:Uncharacterized protein n=1 Tax=bioreactor metagenome TaxID=1076179 RepID=A0A645D3N0_9ZZZZ